MKKSVILELSLKSISRLIHSDIIMNAIEFTSKKYLIPLDESLQL